MGRSRTRRRAVEIQFVPNSTRAKRLSVGALAALTAGPAVALSEASAASDSTSSTDVPTTTEHVVAITPTSGARHVRALQRALGVRADGIFGARTRAAVHHFQTRHGLRRDGVVGPRTTAALRDSTARAASASSAVAPAVVQDATLARHHRVNARAAAEAGGAMYEGAAGDATTRRTAAVAPVSEHTTPVAQHVDVAVSPDTHSSRTTSEASSPTSQPTHAPVKVSETGGSAVHDTPTVHQGSTSSSDSSSSGSSSGVAAVVAAGNRIARLPYRYGGGHGSFKDNAYDCSGSVSYALHGAGLISSPEDSTQLESYGAAGAGKHITIYANSGHTYMTVDGRRFDTVALAQTGSRWTSQSTSSAGYVARHPRGY